MEDKTKKNSNILGLGLLLVLVFSSGLFWGRNVDVNTSLFNFGSSSSLEMDLFWEVLSVTRRNYVDAEDLDEEILVEGAIKGLVESLDDTGTVYLTEEETEEYNKASEGRYFEGIGAELGYESGQIIVVSPLEGSPAKAAGIRPGDYILKVDDYEFKSDDTVYDAVAKIRGEAGTEVVLNVLHKGEGEPVDIVIKRSEITVPSMDLEFINNEIALFSVSRFTDSSYTVWTENWDRKVDEIVDSGVEKVILDLRGNPGGFFDAAIYAADDILDEGYIIAQQRDANGLVEEFESRKGGELVDFDLVVLVNAGSASASEILAGALKDAQRATIVGEDSFGKGTAQRIFNLSDGSTLHLTILKWLLPDGSHIDRENPILPDIEVELTNDDFVNGEDPQLDRAILEINK